MAKVGQGRDKYARRASVSPRFDAESTLIRLRGPKLDERRWTGPNSFAMSSLLAGFSQQDWWFPTRR